MDDWGAQRRGEDCQNQSLQSSFPPSLYSDPVQRGGAVLVPRTWLGFTSGETKNHFICVYFSSCRLFSLSLSLPSIIVIYSPSIYSPTKKQTGRGTTDGICCRPTQFRKFISNYSSNVFQRKNKCKSIAQETNCVIHHPSFMCWACISAKTEVCSGSIR